jgi:WD repeat-containing protein 19
VYDRSGSLVVEVQLESRAQCICLDWDHSGEVRRLARPAAARLRARFSHAAPRTCPPPPHPQQAVAILQTGVERVAVYEVAPTPALLYVDTTLRDPTVACWSRAGPQLAVASASGALLLFRRDTRKRVPILGKHSGAITCAAWSRDGRLALGSADKTLSVSSAEGDPLGSHDLNFAAVSVQWGGSGGGGEGGEGSGAPPLLEPSLTANQGGKSVMLLDGGGAPVELAFAARYGRVVAYTGFGEGRFMLLGFSEGYVVIISTAPEDLGEELFSSGRLLKEPLGDVCASGGAGRAAVAGGSTVRFIDTGVWAEVGGAAAAALTPPAAGPIVHLRWAGDGALLTAATREGGVFTFVARPPLLVAAGGGRVAFASSLRDVTVVGAGEAAEAAADAEARGGAAAAAAALLAGGGGAGAAAAAPFTPFTLYPDTATTLEAPVEPSVLAVGPLHVGAAANNRAWFWAAPPGASPAQPPPAAALLGEWAYPGNVDALLLGSAHSAALCGGRVIIRALEGGGDAVLPQEEAGGGGGGGAAAAGGGGRITAIALSSARRRAGGDFSDYLFTGNAGGVVLVYSLNAGRYLPGAVLRLAGGAGVASIAPNSIGTRAVVTDSAGGVFVFNPCDGSGVAMPPPTAAGGGARAMWDASDPSLFVLAVAGAGGGGEGGGGGGRGSRAASVSGEGGEGGARKGALAAGGGAPPQRLFPFHYSHTTINPGCAPALTPLGAPTLLSDTGAIVMDGGSSPAPPGARPLALVDGRALFAAPGGALAALTLEPFGALHERSGARTAARTRARLVAALVVGRLEEAWAAAADYSALAPPEEAKAGWRAIAGKAMDAMDLATARRAYSKIGEGGMAQSLELLAEGPQERRVVAGGLALLFGDWDLASDHFLQSPQPALALQMRRDLLQWDTAAELAAKVAPEALPELFVEMARAAEWRGEPPAALALFARAEAAVATAAAAAAAAPAAAAAAAAPRGGGARPPAPARGGAPAEAPLPAALAAVRAAARAGTARATLRSGDVRRGVALALEAGGRAHLHECGEIAERLGAKAEAAALFLAAESFDRAGELFLAAGNTGAIAPLVARLTSRRVLRGYAAAVEAAGDAEGAARAYEGARDTEAVVRLLVGKLNALGRAKEVVRATRSREGAAIVAAGCAAAGDVAGAVAFLLLSRARDAAFALAAERGQMGVFVRALLGEGGSGVGGGAAPAGNDAADVAALPPAALGRLPRAECLRVGAYYEGGGGRDPFLAAALYSAAGAHMRALSLLLGLVRAGAGGEEGGAARGAAATAAAIRVAGAARDPAVTSALLAFLTGAEDGLPKDGRHVYALYLALGNYPAAAATAMVLARAETDTPAGVIKTAHGVLFDAHVALAAAGAHVPADLRKLLALLHAYTLVKRLVAGGEHEGAARMISRVARNVSRFPAQATTILTSAVVCCQRGGMKASAFEFACALMGPALKCPEGVREDLKKKIEAMVRRPTAEADAPDAPAPCPFCDAPVPAHALSCAACQSVIPYCVISGRHMTAEDCSQCPHCKFPALHSKLAAWAAGRGGGDGACTMCYAPVSPQSVTLLRDPVKFLRAAAGAAGEAAAAQGASA